MSHDARDSCISFEMQKPATISAHISRPTPQGVVSCIAAIAASTLQQPCWHIPCGLSAFSTLCGHGIRSACTAAADPDGSCYVHVRYLYSSSKGTGVAGMRGAGRASVVREGLREVMREGPREPGRLLTRLLLKLGLLGLSEPVSE